MNTATNPTRRRILLSLAALPLATGTRIAFAQGPAAGKDYALVSPPLPPESATKVEVLEFFSYACPHCYSFEPAVEAWMAKLATDVNFHRVPVVYHEQWRAPARLYYTLEILGEDKRLSPFVFDAIHRQNLDFSKEDVIAKFLETKGIPQKKFLDAFNSFSVQSKMQRGDQLQSQYKIDQVPEMAVDGRYVISNSMTGGDHASVLPVVDYLIGVARRDRKLPVPKA
jgi:protein dithiol oxidoreductase (disulfide-forming)